MTKPKEPPLSKLSKLKVYYEENITWAEAKLKQAMNQHTTLIQRLMKRKNNDRN